MAAVFQPPYGVLVMLTYTAISGCRFRLVSTPLRGFGDADHNRSCVPISMGLFQPPYGVLVMLTFTDKRR